MELKVSGYCSQTETHWLQNNSHRYEKSRVCIFWEWQIVQLGWNSPMVHIWEKKNQKVNWDQTPEVLKYQSKVLITYFKAILMIIWSNMHKVFSSAWYNVGAQTNTTSFNFVGSWEFLEITHTPTISRRNAARTLFTLKKAEHVLQGKITLFQLARYLKSFSPLTSELFILTWYSVTKTELSYFLILN